VILTNLIDRILFLNLKSAPIGKECVMNVRAKAVLFLSSALPVIALAAFLLIQPKKLSADEGTTCSYAGQTYSLGATITAACPSGQVQTCVAQDNWSPCSKIAEVMPVDPQQQ
jgi:hypothetical protein